MKTLSAVLSALTLAVAAAPASAAPVLLTFTNNSIKSKGAAAAQVNDLFSFTLSDTSLLGGSLITFSSESLASVDIRSAFLTHGGTKLALAQVGSGIDVDEDILGTETWALAPQWLVAGDWKLHVIGAGYSAKGFEGYTATFEGRTAELPEPAALALLAVALAGLSLTRRRAL